MEIILDVISYGDRRQNEFMKACDVFEPGKFLGAYSQMKVAGDTVDIANLPTNISKAIEAAGGYALFVSVASIRSADDIDVEFPEPYFKKGVQTISDGKSFGLFKDCLEQIGYKVETDQYMHVTNVSYESIEKVSHKTIK